MKKNIFLKLATLVFCFLLNDAVSAFAQNHPAKDCLLSQIDVTPWHPGPEPRLAEVVAQHAEWLIVCGDKKACIQLPAAKGTPDLVGYEQGKWTCGYEEDPSGSGPGWIRTDALRQINFDLNPPVAGWVGNWVGGEDSVTIRSAHRANTLLVDGSAQWDGGEFSHHFGGVRGNASPSGNRLLLSDEYGCTVYMTLMGRYIYAWDNGGCGGMNVHFGGFWKRVSR